MTPVPHGATAALATPLDEHGNLDEAGLTKLVDRVVGAGVVGISPTGSTGEGARLSRSQRLEVTRLVRERVPAGMPVISGVPLTSVAEGLDELEQLAERGATAALVAPPYYYPLQDVEALRLYENLAERSPLPVVLYNIPVFTKVSFAPHVVGALATHPNIAGIKDSSRDIEYFQKVLAATEGADFAVVTGSDTYLVACLLAGATGTIAASINLVPHLPVGIYDAVKAGDLGEALRLERELGHVIHLCRGGTPPVAWKAALAHVGVCQPYPAAPAAMLPPDQHETLIRELTAVGF